MSRKRAVILGVAAALALASPSLWAQGRRGGGGRPGPGGGPGGGGHPGCSHAVPRGGAPAHPAYAPRAGVAGARHPQAGSGRYYSSHHGIYPRHGTYPSYSHGGYRSHYGGHRSYYGGYRSYYGGYRSYYGGYPYYGGYYGYYRPYPYAWFSFGWPYYAAGAWPNGYYAPSHTVYYYRDSTPAPDEPPAAASSGRVRLEVRPDDASVYLDDEFQGSARDARFLTLRPGRHTIELVRPGYEVVRHEVEVVRGETSDVLVELRRP